MEKGQVLRYEGMNDLVKKFRGHSAVRIRKEQFVSLDMRQFRYIIHFQAPKGRFHEGIKLRHQG